MSDGESGGGKWKMMRGKSKALWLCVRRGNENHMLGNASRLLFTKRLS